MGTRLVSIADIEATKGPPAVVEARGLISAALKIKPRAAVDRERIRWRLERAAALLGGVLDGK